MQRDAEMRKITVFITHNLDEAIRIGGRIAIMNDGALVQIGTPMHIVPAPAAPYGVAANTYDTSRRGRLCGKDEGYGIT